MGGIVLMGALVYLLLKKQTDRALKFVYITAGLSIVFNFMANYSFFPNIYKYQGGNELVKLMKEKDMQIPKENLRLLYTNAHTFDYYLGYNHAITDTAKVPRGDTSITYLVTSPIAKKLREKGYTIDPVLSHVDYNVNAIKFRFLNPKTRNTKLDTLMLAKVY
ncbi:MAG: hypothetical protein NVV59_04905 [Chitinophagaceae bacterium]|nr:hypothetical protein [Chitinophagaceae bacterium]